MCAKQQTITGRQASTSSFYDAHLTCVCAQTSTLLLQNTDEKGKLKSSLSSSSASSEEMPKEEEDAEEKKAEKEQK